MNQLELKKEDLMCAGKISNAKLEPNPFKYTVIDNFLTDDLAKTAMKAFPPLSDSCWHHSNDKGIEVKSRTTCASEFDMPEGIIDVIRIINSSLILHAMSELFEIPKLMPDPYFSGGGLNVSDKNGHLDVHVDGNYNDKTGLNRRMNLIIYLNPNWTPDWGGEFGIYTNNGDTLARSIPPIVNRCVIFDSHDSSYHGLPNPINFPNDDPRKSIIIYYYTKAERPGDQNKYSKPHSALWRSKGMVDKSGKRDRKYF